MGCSSSTEPTKANLSYYGYDETTKVFHDIFELGEKVGQGSFSQVFVVSKKKWKSGSLYKEATNDIMDQPKVVKVTRLQEEHGSTSEHEPKTNNVFNEPRIWKYVGCHRNCMRLFETFYSTKLCYMVAEKCRVGLGEHLLRMSSVNERSMGECFLQMLTAIEYLHSIQVVHRDIKLDNFMVGGDDGMTVKLGDFGFSVLREEEATMGGYLVGVYGTAPYMCPEMVCGHGYNEKSDIWSFAVITYLLLFGSFPYCNPKDPSAKGMKQAVRDGRSPTFAPQESCSAHDDYRSDGAICFVRKLLNRRPDQRPSATDALDIPYMLAVKNGNHMPGQDLPSLHPMVRRAKTSRAFGSHRFRNTTIDMLLERDLVTRDGRRVHLANAILRNTFEGGSDTNWNVDDSFVKRQGMALPLSSGSHIIQKGAGVSFVSTAASSRNASENGSIVRFIQENSNESEFNECPENLVGKRGKANTDPGCIDGDIILKDTRLRSFTL